MIRTKMNSDLHVVTIESIVGNEAVDRLITEGGESFYHYVDSIGLAGDSNLIVLSSRHHYYYDSEEMNNVRTVINLKEFNQIKQLKDFLRSHLCSLPQKCNFIGCFVNNKKFDRYALRDSSSLLVNKKRSDDIGNGVLSRFPLINMLYSIMDSRTNTYMSEKSVTMMLAIHEFKVMDMTDHNGVTFFHSQKVDKTYN